MRLSSVNKLELAIAFTSGFGAGLAMIYDSHKIISESGYALMVIFAIGMLWLIYHHYIVEMDEKPELKIEKPVSAAIKVDGNIGRYGGKTRTIGYDHAVHIGKDGKIEHFEGEVTAQKNHGDSKGKNLP